MCISDKLFAIPLEAFKFCHHGYYYTLNVEKAIFEKTEVFDKNKSSLTREELYCVYIYSRYKPHFKA